MCQELSDLCKSNFNYYPLRLLQMMKQIWDGKVTYPDSHTLVAKTSFPSNLAPKLCTEPLFSFTSESWMLYMLNIRILSSYFL